MIMPPAHLRAMDETELASRFSSLIGRDLAENPPILMKQLRALGLHDSSKRLGELAGIPTLVLSAEHDWIAPPEYGRQLAECIPGARFEQIADASHALTLHRPETINPKLDAFIRAAEAAWTAKSI